MQLTNPAALAFLGLIPILILLHNLKPKPKRVVVTNLFLWQEVQRERGSGITIRRTLTRNLPLILQIVAVILASVAMAGPVWLHAARPAGNTVIVLDTSASMQARDGNRSRFAVAKEKAAAIIADSDEKERLLVISAGARPRVAATFTADKGALQRALDGIAVTDAPGRLEKALLLALSFVDPRGDDRVLFLTDGAGDEFPGILDLHGRITPIQVGQGDAGTLDNVAITKFEFRQKLGDRTRYEIMVALSNTNAASVILPLRLSLGKMIITEQEIFLAAREKRLLFFPVAGHIEGRATAEILRADDFAIDNRAYCVLNPAQETWVLVVGEDNYYWENLLEIYPHFMVNSVPTTSPETFVEQVRNHDIVIVNGQDVPAVAAGRLLLMGSFCPSLPLRAGAGQMGPLPVDDWDRSHPIMAKVNLDPVTLAEVQTVETPQSSVAGLAELARTTHGGLIYAYADRDLRMVFMGFDLARSDLPFQVAFPVMMNNVFHWLRPEISLQASVQTRAGEPLPIHLRLATRQIAVRDPKGNWQRLGVSAGFHAYGETQRTGFYLMAEGKRRRHYAVSLNSASESDLGSRVSANPTAAVGRPEAVAQAAPVRYPFWVFILLAVPLLLVVEWYYWLKER